MKYTYNEELMDEYYSRTQPVSQEGIGIKDEDYEYTEFPVALEGMDYLRLLHEVEEEELEYMRSEWRRG